MYIIFKRLLITAKAMCPCTEETLTFPSESLLACQHIYDFLQALISCNHNKLFINELCHTVLRHIGALSQ